MKAAGAMIATTPNLLILPAHPTAGAANDKQTTREVSDTQANQSVSLIG
jgi:hypothetical protein